MARARDIDNVSPALAHRRNKNGPSPFNFLDRHKGVNADKRSGDLPNQQRLVSQRRSHWRCIGKEEERTTLRMLLISSGGERRRHPLPIESCPSPILFIVQQCLTKSAEPQMAQGSTSLKIPPHIDSVANWTGPWPSWSDFGSLPAVLEMQEDVTTNASWGPLCSCHLRPPCVLSILTIPVQRV